jgi:hypothetical protein
MEISAALCGEFGAQTARIFMLKRLFFLRCTICSVVCRFLGNGLCKTKDATVAIWGSHGGENVGCRSSGLWRCLVLSPVTSVSEERVVSIFRWKYFYREDGGDTFLYHEDEGDASLPQDYQASELRRWQSTLDCLNFGLCPLSLVAVQNIVGTPVGCVMPINNSSLDEQIFTKCEVMPFDMDLHEGPSSVLNLFILTLWSRSSSK